MQYVLSQQGRWEYGYASALAWIYFAIVGAILGIVCMIVNKFVYYENE
jgi:ABC-type sugar transport system permease subunit